MPHPNIRITYIQPYNFPSIPEVIIEGYEKFYKSFWYFAFRLFYYK
jgi:hypothetical protein